MLLFVLACARSNPTPSLAPEVLERLCADPCAGEISVFRDSQMEIQRILFASDLSNCSHGVHLYTDKQGQELLVLSDSPSTPAQLEPLHKQKSLLLEGLTQSKSKTCASLKNMGFRWE